MSKTTKTGRDEWTVGEALIQRRFIRTSRTTPARRAEFGIKTVERFCRAKFDVFVGGRLVSPIEGIDSFKAAETFAARVAS